MPEGGYNVLAPAIPEICTFGETLEEAREMAGDAIRCYLESALETSEPIPSNISKTATQRRAVSRSARVRHRVESQTTIRPGLGTMGSRWSASRKVLP